MNISINVMALLLEVEDPSWLGLPFQPQELWPHILPADREVIICTLRPVFQRMLQLKWAVGSQPFWCSAWLQAKDPVSWWQLLCGFLTGSPSYHLTEIPTSSAPKRYSSKWPMPYTTETACFLGKRWANRLGPEILGNIPPFLFWAKIPLIKTAFLLWVSLWSSWVNQTEFWLPHCTFTEYIKAGHFMERLKKKKKKLSCLRDF